LDPAVTAAAERERVLAIRKLAQPGAEGIIAAAIANRLMTPGKTARKILEAQRDRMTLPSEVDGLSAAGRSLLATVHRMNAELEAERPEAPGPESRTP